MVSYVNVKTRIEAERSLDAVDRALLMVAEARAGLGAMANRIQSAVNSLGEFFDQNQNSESGIRDVDMALAVTEMTRHTIKSQVSTSMIAQANIMQQAALQLMRA
ncbi:MAG: flagellin [Candidatus Hydrogenedentota bacterium]